MSICDPIESPSQTESQAAPGRLPPDVELIISALEAGGGRTDNRRRHPRMRYRVAGDLRLFSDEPGTPPWRIYTRDSSARGLGFITRHRLPLGYGGVVRLMSPAGQMTSVNGTLFRCRDLGNDWFEGAIYFNRDQWSFAAC
jgi:hypothetical protein